MSGEPTPYPPYPSFLCYVLVEGPVHGSGAVLPFVLAVQRTATPDDALRWLQRQARWVADRLDPDPAVSPWVVPAMRTDRVPVPDAPTEIRVWSDAPDEERAARARLDQGVAVSVVIPDGPDRYTFAICPQRAPVRRRPRPFIVLAHFLKR
ncbi:hypothetical protein ACFVIM_16360 [Streptomyces sp. NPDC057638]|uniref:hypothetical protein n=1 Tax=Streptomyces sp. NPDC057638 TaxID=3346190 RepID=UPI00367B5BA7